jgi:transposase
LGLGNPKGVECDFEQLERRRHKAARLFDRGFRRGKVARRLGVHRQSVCRWHQAWKKQGTKALIKAARAGRKPRLQPVQLEHLGQGLKEGPDALGYGTALWTTWRVADLIERQTGQKFHPGHVWRILRSLGWSCQRPVGRATQRHEPAILQWKRVRWPDIKKNTPAAPNDSFCGQKRFKRAASSGPNLAHCRRGFHEALAESKLAAWFFGQIGMLYAMEKKLGEQKAGPQLRAAIYSWQRRASFIPGTFLISPERPTAILQIDC